MHTFVLAIQEACMKMADTKGLRKFFTGLGINWGTAVSVGSLLFLIWSLLCMIPNGESANDHEGEGYRIVATTAPHYVGTKGGWCEINAFFIDGVHVYPKTAAQISKRTGFTPSGFFGEWGLRHESSGTPSEVFVDGEDVVLWVNEMEKWTATIEIFKGDKLLHRLTPEDHKGEGHIYLRLHELGKTGKWFAINLLLGVLLPIALFLLSRPWASSSRGVLWIASFTGLLYLGYWACQPITLITDSGGYRSSWDFFKTEGNCAYFPIGTGLFQDFSKLIPMSAEALRIALMQAILFIGLATVLQDALTRFGNLSKTVAMFAIIFAFSAVTNLKASHMLGSEPPTILMLGFALYFTLLASRTKVIWRFALFILLASFVGVIAAFCRIVPAAVSGLFCLVAAWPLLPLSKKRIGRFALLCIPAICILFSILGVSRFSEKNGGTKGMSNVAGEHLFNAMVHRSEKMFPELPATKRFLEMMPISQEEIIAMAPYSHMDRRALLQKHGNIGYHEAIDLQGQVAKETLKKIPFLYLKQSIIQAHEQIQTYPEEWWGRTTYDEASENWLEPPLMGVDVGALYWREGAEELGRTVWRIFAWMFYVSIAIAAVARYRNVVYWMLVTWVLTLALSSAMVEFLYARYSMSLLLPLVLSTVIGLAIPFRALWHRFSPKKDAVSEVVA